MNLKSFYLNEFTNSTNILELLAFIANCSRLSGIACCVFVYMSVGGHVNNLHLSVLDFLNYMEPRCSLVHNPVSGLSGYSSFLSLSFLSVDCIQVLSISKL